MKQPGSANAQSLQEKAYLHLLGKILSGELPPGTGLSEASIARDLGNSRGPLREAVRRLTAEGFLRQSPNRGSVVVEFGRRDVAEMYELREALEVYAVRKAAEKTLRPQDLETARRLVEEVLVLRDELEASGQPQLNPAQMKRFIELDFSFHRMLVRAAANGRILKVVADTRILLNIFAMRRNGHDATQLSNIHRYHSEILEAVVRQDPETAMRLMSEHIRTSQLERLREYDEIETEEATRHSLLDLGSFGTP